MDLHALLTEGAKSAGFAASGALDLQAISEEISRYDEWLASGYAGAMEYLKRGRDRRADPRVVFPEAKSILCVALPYPKQAAGSVSTAEGVRYARYLQGPDYHEDLALRLEQVMKTAAETFFNQTGRKLRWKTCVDTSAVLERSWAALAGLGWVGKNTMLIHPKLGSYFFLGTVLLNEPVSRGPAPLPDYCGNCTRCLTSCPTQAIVKPHLLDSRLCISYLTLEKRGPFEASESTLKRLGNWVAGCDVCQEACPFNLKPVREETESPPANGTDLQTWEALLNETETEYRARIGGSALSRIKAPQFRRNLARALANSLRLDARPLAPLRTKVLARAESESDEAARAEWLECAKLISET
ncbi:MAG: tRNA epoxyqueuosine(34) reductase QueG [Bdellovibrionota bacterium]